MEQIVIYCQIVNDTEIIKFKAKDLEIIPYSLCLGNISKDWTNDNMKKKWLHDLMVTFMILVLIIMSLINLIY